MVLAILGGRVARERHLPRQNAWGHLANYREYQISQKANVDTYFDSNLDSESILEFGFGNICIATRARRRQDSVSRQHVVPFPTDDAMSIFTPVDLIGESFPTGYVVIFDNDHYYMGGVMAEFLIQKGCMVTLVTPAA